MAGRWSDPELAEIRPGRSAATIAKKTGRTEAAVSRKAKELGVPLRGTMAARRPRAKKPERRAAPPRPLISAAGSASPELVEHFISSQLKLVDGRFYGMPFNLEPWQRDDIIEPIFGTLEADGSRQYHEAVLGLPRDSGKSELSAAIALAMMFLEPVSRGKYVVIARNREQARIVFEKARYMVLSNPDLKAMCDVRTSEIIVKETGQRFFTMPWDAGSVQGLHAQLVIIDEYHVHRNDTVRYAALSGMTHQHNHLLITISTAGAARKGPLWDLLHGPKNAYDDPRAYVHWIGASDDDDPTDPKVWKKANPQSWATERSLKMAFDAMPLWEFERYHLNRFPMTAGIRKAFGAALLMPAMKMRMFDRRLPCVVAVDGAPRRDNMSLVIDQRQKSGMHYARAWIFQSEEMLGGYNDYLQLADLLRGLVRDFNVVRIVFDPSFMWQTMNELMIEGLPIEEFPQDNPRMTRVAQNLYDLLQQKRMRFGKDTALYGHLDNVGVLERPPWGWRMAKAGGDHEYIDAAIALGMAAYVSEAESGSFSGPQVFVSD